jgi:GNAT superfamily N-acetyltransferase
MDSEDYREDLPGGMILRASTFAGSPLVEHFFAGYDRAFVLPDEREEIEGFRACLALNQTLPLAFGRRHRELVLTLEAADGTLLGGANFLATAMTASGGPPISIALNYAYVERAARGRGMLRLLVDAVGRVASLALSGRADGPAPAIFIEQNDPLRLSDADYAADTAHAGIDQIDRLAIWARLGARMVDFPYVQPALSSDQDCDDGLIYAALAFPDNSVPSLWLHDHLQSFFGVSVCKGKPLEDDAAAMAQLAALSSRADPVALLSVDAAITALKARGRSGAGHDFRSFVKGLGDERKQRGPI